MRHLTSDEGESRRPRRLTDPAEASRLLGTAVATLRIAADVGSIEIDEAVYSDDELIRVQIRYLAPGGDILVRTTKLDPHQHVLATGLRTSLAEAVLALEDPEGEHGDESRRARARLESAQALRDEPTMTSRVTVDDRPHIAQMIKYRGRSALGFMRSASHIIVAGPSPLLEAEELALHLLLPTPS